MQWKGRRESENVEDRRSLGKAGLAIGGGVGVLVMIVALFLGLDENTAKKLGQMFQGGGGNPAAQQGPPDPKEEERVKFVKVVLADTEDVWNEQFRQLAKKEGNPKLKYREPRLVLFRGEVKSACGFANAAVGPFYCPGDENLYIDLQFFDELGTRFKAPGDFAQAYVIAHEVGHHVQNLLGTMEKVHRQQKQLSKTDFNKLSVRLELQADFYAGVWAHHAQRTKKILEPGDLEEALKAAFAIGDDRLQKQAQGYVVPDSFTHGTSEQRIHWFKRGYETGDIYKGDTFRVDERDL